MDKLSFLRELEIYCFDIDGTICTNTYGDYEKAIPYKKRIQKINSLFKKGAIVNYLTARGMGSCHGNVEAANKKYYEYTYKQLYPYFLVTTVLFLLTFILALLIFLILLRQILKKI